jgi:hypothetical protein
MSVAPHDETFEPISLGSMCQSKYQTSRVAFQGRDPPAHDALFRLALLGTGSELDPRRFKRHVFDWQVTPVEALTACLERDFKGAFDLEDLALDEATGEVFHTRLGTRHPHQFHTLDGRLTPETMAAAYPVARAKFEHLARRFRDHLTAPGPFLYVLQAVPSRAQALHLAALLSARSPGHRFRILFVGREGQAHDLHGLEGMSVGRLPEAIDKPADRIWEGDDRAWDTVLAPFSLRLPGQQTPAQARESGLREARPRRLLPRLIEALRG